MIALMTCCGIILAIGIIRCIESIYDYIKIDYRLRKVIAAQDHLIDLLDDDYDEELSNKLRISIESLNDLIIELEGCEENENNCGQ